MPRCFRVCSALLVLALLGAPLGASAQPAPPPSGDAADKPLNVILMIPDGFGPASGTMARDYLRWKTGTGVLALDSLQRGSVRTFSADSRVTDSAAGATAYATGQKTYNGAIAVDTSKQALGTLLQGAEAKGMATGLVATSRITHATPASFSAHVPNRWMENTIAAQQIAKDVEVILGGGRRHFLPEDEGGEREDERNLIDDARERGYQYVDTRDALLNADATPVLGLFDSSHMDYEIDRDPAQQPSLAEMTTTALDLLSTNEDGFFLMVEGSRIDHAGHANDAAAHLHDILAYDEAVEAALAFAQEQGNTLVVSVSDHETGGMSLGREVDGDGLYAWEPAVLNRVRASHGVIIDSLRAAVEAAPAPEDAGLGAIVQHFTQVSDLTEAEVDRLEAAGTEWGALEAALTEIVSRRAVVGWTTGGHTAVDVNLNAYGPGANRFIGNMDNTEVGQILASLLNIDLSALTADLRADDAAESEGVETGR